MVDAESNNLIKKENVMNLKEELKDLQERMLIAQTAEQSRKGDDLLRETLKTMVEGVYVESMGMYDFREDVSKILKSYNKIEKW
jgi:hypothetical protein